MPKSETEIQRIVLHQLSQLTGVAPEKIRRNAKLIEDLRVDGDDLSFLFIPAVEREAGVHVRPDAWTNVFTVEQVVDLVHASQREPPDS